MNFRYTIYNRVSGLYMKNECEAANEKMFVITLLETMGSGSMAKYQSHV